MSSPEQLKIFSRSPRAIAVSICYDRKAVFGEMAEWLKAQHWKCCLGETLTRVRIPLSPFSGDRLQRQIRRPPRRILARDDRVGTGVGVPHQFAVAIA